MPDFKVGVALGAGAARGLANIGVLQVLEEHKIPIHAVAGTSAGALIGVLYAAGADLKLLAKMADEMVWNDLVSFTITKWGLVSSDKIHQMMRLLTQEKRFEDLNIPTAVVATDLATGKEVVIDSGLAADGAQASMSIPGIFVPVQLNGRTLVDGALVDRVPVQVCRNLGADFVIAVDVGVGPLRSKLRNLSDVIINSIDILQHQVVKSNPVGGDIVLNPDLGNVTFTQLNRAGEIIEKGREVALANIDEIKRLIGLKLDSYS
ncbi:MAG TPA: patatin family protein [Firmicutes bacterium]|nr:patatin family protein [Bacillota bacterium]